MERLTELAAAQVLAAAGRAVRARRLAEVADLEVLAQWAALHGDDPAAVPGARGAHARRVGDVLVHPAGEGTPGVQEFCLGEIALARGAGVTATVNALADVLDLQHRLPRTWDVVRTGVCEVWVARKVARLSRHLPADRVALVDAAVAEVIGRQPGGRVVSLAEGRIVEADPALHELRVADAMRRRYVALSRTDEAGLRTVIARVEAGDAVWIEATVARVAEVLAPASPALGVDELRAHAFGLLARPAELLALLLAHSERDDEDVDARRSTAAEGPAPHPDGAGAGWLNRAVAFPDDLLPALAAADFSAWAPRCTLYAHVLADRAAGAVARVEGVGPMVATQVRRLLGRAHVAVRPVIDLSDRVSTVAYEHPVALKERVHLIAGGDYFPHAASTSRGLDYDHPTPYRHPPRERDVDDGEPDGRPQTGVHNSGPLGRRHHRWKTHAGYHARQSGLGRYAWLTPHGQGFLVDHAGTHPIDPDDARMIIDAPPGVDVYPSSRLEVQWVS